MCNKIGCLFSNIFYLVEKFTVMTACVGLLTCLVVTLIMMLMLGIGLGYNYCYVDYQSRARYRYVPAHYYTVRPAKALRSGSESPEQLTGIPPNLKYVNKDEMMDPRTTKIEYYKQEVEDVTQPEVIIKQATYFNPQSQTTENDVLSMFVDNIQSSVKTTTEKITIPPKRDFPYTDSMDFIPRFEDDQPLNQSFYLRRMQSLYLDGITGTDIANLTNSSLSRITTASSISTVTPVVLPSFPGWLSLTPSTKITYKRENSTIKRENIKYYKFWAIAETEASTESTSIKNAGTESIRVKKEGGKLENTTQEESLVTDASVVATRTTSATNNNMISINGLDLMALLSQLRAENRNYSLQILTS